MPVWTNPSISEVPTFSLVSWAVFEVKLGLNAEVTRHVVGEVGHGGEGQVSSPVLEFDPVSASFRTRSGRVYRLIPGSSPGLGREAEYVWNAWCSTWRSEFEPRNVTAEVAQEIAQAHARHTGRSATER
jgi:hypothetical protein